MHIRFALIALLCTLSMSACAVQQPTIQAKNASLTSLSLRSLDFLVKLKLDNPNTFALPLEQMIWALDIAKKPLMDGNVPMTEEIKPQATANIDVPLSVSYEKLIVVGTEILKRQSIPYALNGSLNFKTPVGPLILPYNIEGGWKNPLTSGIELPTATTTVSLELPPHLLQAHAAQIP